MKPVVRGLILAAVQAGLVASLGAKLLYDRARLPRVWVEVVPVDPVLPIRGTYVRLSPVIAELELPEELLDTEEDIYALPVVLRAEDGYLVAQAVDEEESPTGTVTFRPRPGTADDEESEDEEEQDAILNPPLAFFIPEHMEDSFRLAEGATLWAEVTVPPNGPPRPIRLGIARDGKPIDPLGE